MRAQERIIGWLCERQKEIHRNNIEVRPDTDILQSGLVDSLGFLHLITFIEDQYQLEIPVELLTPENFSTPKNVGELVERIAGLE